MESKAQWRAYLWTQRYDVVWNFKRWKKETCSRYNEPNLKRRVGLIISLRPYVGNSEWSFLNYWSSASDLCPHHSLGQSTALMSLILHAKSCHSMDFENKDAVTFKFVNITIQITKCRQQRNCKTAQLLGCGCWWLSLRLLNSKFFKLHHEVTATPYHWRPAVSSHSAVPAAGGRNGRKLFRDPNLQSLSAHIYLRACPSVLKVIWLIFFHTHFTPLHPCWHHHNESWFPGINKTRSRTIPSRYFKSICGAFWEGLSLSSPLGGIILIKLLNIN